MNDEVGVEGNAARASAPTLEDGAQVRVLIVGAGPAGMTLALDLASRGVFSLIVEATSVRSRNPRCNTTSARSMEIFRRLGLADTIRAAGLPADYPPSVQYRTTLTGHELYRIDMPTPSAVFAGEGRDTWPTPEPQHRISQLFLEPLLEDACRQTEGVDLVRGATLTSFEQDDEGVEVTVDHVGGTVTMRCDYLVGCDGAHSQVRRGLGIRYQGVDALSQFVSTFVRSPELGRIARQDPAWTYWTYGRRNASLIAIDGEDLWLNHVAFPAEHDTSAEDPQQLLYDAVGRTVDFEALGVVRWTGRQLVAERYRDRRVFLAGDAAHIWVPVGGFGMNAGIQDAAALGWMLGAVCNGWAPGQLLDAYEAERRPVGEQFAEAVGAKARVVLGERCSDIHLDGPVGDEARRSMAERLAASEPGRYSPDGFSFGYHYAASPLVVGAEEQHAVEMGSFVDQAQVGFRLPHAWLEDGRSVLDVLGPELTLVCTDPAADVSSWREAAEKLRVPLSVAYIPDSWPESYPQPLLLVRPDQHVAWAAGCAASDLTPEMILRTVSGRAAGVRHH